MPHELTILCVYYNEAQLHRYLGASLEKQTYRDYELLLVNNTKNTYRNMRDAVASVRDDVNGTYVMLLHPDVSFPQEDTLSRIVSDCRAGFPEYDILGGAGIREDQTVVSAVVQADGYRPGEKPERITSCFSLDECIVVMPRAVFDAYPLADLGRSWHMYIVELCCRLAAEGKKTGVFTPDTVHQSDGNLDRSYYSTMLRLASRYAGTFPVIYSTCSIFPTSRAKISGSLGEPSAIFTFRT